MNPEEKAKELVDKYYNFGDQEFDYSKEFALIAVDEIMKAPHENSYIELIPQDAESTDWFWDKFDEYWNQVKHEIEQL